MSTEENTFENNTKTKRATMAL